MKTRTYLDANILITAFRGQDQKIIKVHVFFMKGGAYFLTIFRYCTIIDISLCDSHNILVRPNLQLLQTQHGCNWLRMSRYDTLFSDSYQPCQYFNCPIIICFSSTRTRRCTIVDPIRNAQSLPPARR